MTPTEFRSTADSFTKAYVECALWSSSAEIGTCDKCGEERVQSDPQTERHTKQANGNPCGGRVSGTDLSFTDREFDIENIAPESLDSIVADCAKFQTEQAELLTEENCLKPSIYDDRDPVLGRAGHDFWLNRNGHGAGFWDGDWEKIAGDKLSDASHAFGETDPYLGDDGRIYLS